MDNLLKEGRLQGSKNILKLRYRNLKEMSSNFYLQIFFLLILVLTNLTFYLHASYLTFSSANYTPLISCFDLISLKLFNIFKIPLISQSKLFLKISLRMSRLFCLSILFSQLLVRYKDLMIK